MTHGIDMNVFYECIPCVPPNIPYSKIWGWLIAYCAYENFLNTVTTDTYASIIGMRYRNAHKSVTEITAQALYI